MVPVRLLSAVIAASIPLSWPTPVGPRDTLKRDAMASIDRRAGELIQLSDSVWRLAETALRERHSAAVLADYAERQGFRVERGVGGLPTAFVASYGSGRPVIAILGEYDALPGLSQEVATTHKPRSPGKPGHGCGHNLFGAGSLGAAVAVKELIAAGRLKGTVRFYGTPAEETSQGKTYLIRAGLFDDVDAALAWHPSDETMVDLDSFQAIVAFHLDFKGRTAHAAADPWNGRSAVDAMELFTHGVNMLREHVRPTVRMHYTLQHGGVVPNVVPDSARVWMWVRDSKREGVQPVLARVREIAQGAALMAGVTHTLTPQTGAYELLTNLTGARALNANLAALGPIRFTEQEQSFAKAIQRSTGVPEKGLNGTLKPLPDTTKPPPGGSSDVGDVSWVVPTLHFSATTGAEGAPWHAWPVVATSGMSIGHKGMVYAAKGLAMTAIDLFDDAKLLADMRAEFTQRRGDRKYVPFVPDGPPPLPKDVAP